VERVVAPRPRGPVDGVFQGAGDGSVVFGGDEQHGVGRGDRVLQRGGLGWVVGVVVRAVQRQVPDRDLFGVTSCSRCCATVIRPNWTPSSRSCATAHMPTGCIPPRRAENRDRLSGPAHPTGPAAHPARMGPEHPDRGLSCSGTGFPVHAISSTWPRCRYTVAREIPRAVAITVALSPLARRAKAAASLSGPVTVVNAQHRRVVVGSPASHIRSFSEQRLYACAGSARPSRSAPSATNLPRFAGSESFVSLNPVAAGIVATGLPLPQFQRWRRRIGSWPGRRCCPRCRVQGFAAAAPALCRLDRYVRTSRSRRRPWGGWCVSASR